MGAGVAHESTNEDFHLPLTFLMLHMKLNRTSAEHAINALLAISTFL